MEREGGRESMSDCITVPTPLCLSVGVVRHVPAVVAKGQLPSNLSPSKGCGSVGCRRLQANPTIPSPRSPDGRLLTL